MAKNFEATAMIFHIKKDLKKFLIIAIFAIGLPMAAMEMIIRCVFRHNFICLKEIRMTANAELSLGFFG